MKRFATPLALLAALLPATAVAEPATLRVIEAEGTRFKVTLNDGRVLRSPELVGAILVVAGDDGPIRIRIEAVERDAADKRLDVAPAEAVWLHTFSVQTEAGDWRPLCRPGPDGRAQGFPLAGRRGPDGRLEPASPGVFDLVCTAGAWAKCVRFGYRPWNDGHDGPARLAAYNACVRMVRADYGGEGDGTTRNGMRIDVYDDWRIQAPEMAAEDVFEAGWSPEGAVCVHHVRVRENTSLAALEERYPRLKGRTGAVCTEAFARAHGAILFNRSSPDGGL